MILIGEATINGFVHEGSDAPGLRVEGEKVVRWICSLPVELGDEIIVIRRSAREKAAA